MKGSDITIMIYKLGILNNYLEEDKKESEKDIKYWEEQIKEFGKDGKIASGTTYEEMKKMSKQNLNVTLDDLKESNRLIEMLENEIENI